MAFRIGGDADLEIRDTPQAFDQFGGALVAIRADIRLAGGQVATQRHDMPHAALPVAGRNLIDLGTTGADAGEVRGRHERGFAHQADHGCVRSLPRAAACAVGDRDESGMERLQPADTGPELRLQRLGLRGEELEGERGRGAAALGQRQGAEAGAADPTFKNWNIGRQGVVHRSGLVLRPSWRQPFGLTGQSPWQQRALRARPALAQPRYSSGARPAS